MKTSLLKAATEYKQWLKNAYEFPSIEKGDIILTGKYKNVPAKVTGKSTDDANQPVLSTTKGERHVHSFRLKKLMGK
jgi:hypothetical protein